MDEIARSEREASETKRQAAASIEKVKQEARHRITQEQEMTGKTFGLCLGLGLVRAMMENMRKCLKKQRGATSKKQKEILC